jgi:hypothetical protein
MLAVFLANSFITTAATFIYEKNYLIFKKQEKRPLITPKCNGAST